ncbi:MAG: hypothetical protein ACFFFH_15675 [Candidatus Thorarchaeota archaeon]
MDEIKKLPEEDRLMLLIGEDGRIDSFGYNVSANSLGVHTSFSRGISIVELSFVPKELVRWLTESIISVILLGGE